MLRLLSLLLAGILLFASCNTRKPEDPLDDRIEKVKADRDFSLFREILEKAHPSLTDYTGRKRMDFLFDSIAGSIQPPLTLRSFYNKLSFIVNEIGCSHTFTSLPNSIVDSLYNKELFFPFPVSYIDGGLIANSDYVVPAGTKILTVNDVPVKNILDSLMIYNSVEGMHRETQRYLTTSDFSYDYYVRFGGYKKFDLLIKDTSGKIRSIAPYSISLSDLNERRQNLFYYDATDVPYYLNIHNDDNYAVMRLSTFKFDSDNQQLAFECFLSNSFELLADKKNINTLIIDLRENTGGDLYDCFLLNSYICKDSFPEYKSVSTKISRIPYEEYLANDFDNNNLHSIDDKIKDDFTVHDHNRYKLPDSLIDHWGPSKNQFLKRVVVVTNQRTVSSGSYFALLARNTAGAKIIGIETSGGNFSGNGFSTLKYSLPSSGIGFQFCYANIIYSYGGRKNGRGIIPDYIIPDNYISFKENKDRQLNFIIDSLISK